MIIALGSVILFLLGWLIVSLVKNRRLEDSVSAAKQEAENSRQHCESETRRIYEETRGSVAEAQKLIDQQIEDIKKESERVREHYEAEAKKAQEAASAFTAKTIKDFEHYENTKAFAMLKRKRSDNSLKR